MRQGLTAIGLTTLDVVALPIDALPADERTVLVEDIAFAPAGTAGGAALIAARLGLDTRLISAVGDDQAGRFLRLALEDGDVDTALLETLSNKRTSTTLLAVDSEGRRPNFHALGAGGLARTGAEAVAAVRASKFLHYAGVGGRHLDGGPGEGLLREARDGGVIVTCDLISPGPSARGELERLLPWVDFFMPSAAEARALTGLDDLNDAGETFRRMGARACIIKNGGEGSIALVDGERIDTPAFAITPVDTTSCGDAFCAGFIVALDEDWPVREALRFATATAALVAQGPATLGRLESFAATRAAMLEMSCREPTP